MKPKRENGFYWVKHEGEWHVARWSNRIMDGGYPMGWYFTGYEMSYQHMEEIGPKVERP